MKPKWRQNRGKMEPRGVLRRPCQPEPPPSAHRQRSEPPMCVQDGPKGRPQTVPETPRKGEGLPKVPPRSLKGPKRGRKWIQNGAQRGIRAKMRICKKPKKTKGKHRFFEGLGGRGPSHMLTGSHQNPISKAKRSKVGPKWRHSAEKNQKNRKTLHQNREKSSGGSRKSASRG